MKVYNLTDKQPPTSPTRKAKVVLVGGQQIPPGEGREISDTFRKGSVSGLIRRHVISFDKLPGWYQRARRRDIPDLGEE